MTDADAGAPAEVDAPPRCYRHPDRETWITCQRCGRPICPQCQTPAAVGVHCPECVREGRADMPRASATWARRLRPGAGSVVTYTLIAINVVFFGLQWLFPQFELALFLWPYTIGSEPWRLITSAFLHSRGTIVLHLLFNMYALFIVGPLLESFLGRIRFLALYLIGALAGSLGYLTYVEIWYVMGAGEPHPGGALGASGAVFALMGAVLALRRPLGVDVRQLLIVLAINLAFPFFVGGIAWEAHVGGLIVGFLIGVLLLRTRRREQRVAQALGVAGVALGLLVLFVVYLVSAPQLYF
jgi:membrane associated rhomboid family serine protease